MGQAGAKVQLMVNKADAPYYYYSKGGTVRLNTRFVSLGSALAVGTTMLLGGAAAWADDSASILTTCQMRADRPNLANDAIVGRQNCSNTIAITGYIDHWVHVH